MLGNPWIISLLCMLAQACSTATRAENATHGSSSDASVEPDAAIPEEHVILDAAFETDPNLVRLRAPCSPGRYLRGFELVMNIGDGYTSFGGAVDDVPNPSENREEVAVDESCRLLKKPLLLCDPPCTSGNACGSDETCQRMPVQQDLGTLVVQGLAKTLVLRPSSLTNSYFARGLPHPGFAPDQVIHLSTTAGFLGRVDLYGIGVYPLAPWTEPVTLTENAELGFTWEAPPGTVRSVMHVELSIDQHGATPLKLVCDFPDVGHAAVTSDMVNELIASGVTGYPSGIAARQTVDAMETSAGCADFRTASVSKLPVEVTGHTPCMKDNDCTRPASCNPTTRQCD